MSKSHWAIIFENPTFGPHKNKCYISFLVLIKSCVLLNSCLTIPKHLNCGNFNPPYIINLLRLVSQKIITIRRFEKKKRKLEDFNQTIMDLHFIEIDGSKEKVRIKFQKYPITNILNTVTEHQNFYKYLKTFTRFSWWTCFWKNCCSIEIYLFALEK